MPTTEGRTESKGSRGFSRYGAAALAMGAGIAAGGQADADVIYTNPPDVTIDNSTYQLDVDGNSVFDFDFMHTALPDPAIDGFGLPGNGLVGTPGTPYAKVSQLSVGTVIGPGSTFIGAGNMGVIAPGKYVGPPVGTIGGPKGPWGTGGTGFVGLRFEGSSTHYGWARFNANPNTLVLTLFDYAYEDVPDRAIRAGATGAAVPEPSAVLLLAAGAAAVGALRRRKS